MRCLRSHTLSFLLFIHFNNANEQQIFSTSKFGFCFAQTNSSIPINHFCPINECVYVCLTLLICFVHARLKPENCHSSGLDKRHKSNGYPFLLFSLRHNSSVCVYLLTLNALCSKDTFDFIHQFSIGLRIIMFLCTQSHEWMNLHCIETVCTFGFLRFQRLRFIEWRKHVECDQSTGIIQWNHALSNRHFLTIVTTQANKIL